MKKKKDFHVVRFLREDRYTFIRRMSLEGQQTQSEACGIKVERSDKWVTLQNVNKLTKVDVKKMGSELTPN